MKIVFIGSVDMSYAILDLLIRLGADIAGVVTRGGKGVNADHADLTPLCRKASIPWLLADQVSAEETAQWVRDKGPDMVCCFGWSYLLKEDLLSIPPRGVLGYHPALLPRNRGRHPLIWTLVLGLEEAGSSFFVMDEGTDSGDIISQRSIPVNLDDTAATLYEKVKTTVLSQVEDFFPRLVDKTLEPQPQDHSRATYWRKRSSADGFIDFRMSSRAVYNLVRALTRPYPGAHLVYKGQEVKVWKAEEIPGAESNIEPGRVLASGPDGIEVKCYTGGVRILEHGFEELPAPGEYIL